MKLGTFCSGIGAPEVAAHGMMEPIWFSEIEPFPCSVLAQRWPGVPNLGDMTAPDIVSRIAEIGLPDVVVAGLPCQPFSVAGLRRGESDPRNLTMRFVEIADAIDDIRRDHGQPPVWWVVENVPGLLSDTGNAFGSLLGAMVGSNAPIEPSGRWQRAGVAIGSRRSAAWRTLDAQHFGLAQRRQRVFIVFVDDSGKGAPADALLPIIESVSWHSPPSRETGERTAAGTLRSTDGGSCVDNARACHLIPEVVGTLSDGAHNGGGLNGQDAYSGRIIPVAHALRGEGFDASEDGTGRATPLVPVAIQERAVSENPENGPQGAVSRTDGVAYTLEARTVPQAVGFAQNQRDEVREMIVSGAQSAEPGMKQQTYVAFDTTQITSPGNYSQPHPGGPCHPLAAGAHAPALATPWAVRRLTPRECARLQGFPDDHTEVEHRGKPAADGPQYKAYGNSMAVPCIRWILDRLKISWEAHQ